MSKITEKAYAKALWQSAIGKKKSDINSLSRNLIKLLIKNNDLKKGDKIIEELIGLKRQEEKILEIIIQSAKPLNAKEKDIIESVVKKQTAYKVVEIKNDVEPSLIAGWGVQIGWEKIENTLKGRLNQLKQVLNKI